jgi:DNA-binding LacI/PurR family transcriptional regulator
VGEPSGDKLRGGGARPISLRDLGKHLGLSPTTVSLVLNGSPAARSIPAATQRRVIAAARELNYRPNFLARSLRSQKSGLVGVMLPEVGEGYSSLVLRGIEERLLEQGYVYLVTSHRHKPELIDRGPRLLYERSVEGVIAVDSPIREELPVPVVSVSGHDRVPGVANIVLDHGRAADQGIAHLAELGHRRIAVIRGQRFSSDSKIRWQTISQAARRRGVPIHRDLVAELKGDSPSPHSGAAATRGLLAAGARFTALWAFNDVSAIGAIRALHEAGLRVPEDVSVLGFDDIYSAAFHTPALSTVRQPLDCMGRLAADVLLERIQRPAVDGWDGERSVEPELVARESTGPAPS